MGSLALLLLSWGAVAPPPLLSWGALAPSLLLLLLPSAKAQNQEPLRKNCFSRVDENQWGLVLDFSPSSASLSVLVTGAGSSVQTCLRRQESALYQVPVVGDLQSAKFLSPSDHLWQGQAATLLTSPPTFTYLIYPGRYRLRLTYCGPQSCDDSSIHETVFSDFLDVRSSVVAGCEDGGLRRDNRSGLTQHQPEVRDMTALFSFSFPPCSLHSYDTANLSLYSSAGRADCGRQLIFEATVAVSAGSDGRAVVSYLSPELRGDRYYCVSLTLSHVSCRLAALRREEQCVLRLSDPVWIPAVPLISTLIPFCTSYFACAWLYVTVGGSFFLLLSLVLALVLVSCCRRRERRLKAGDEVDYCEGELQEIRQERVSWGSLHKEWECREEKARGKILLLYSPDTKLFKELQLALKSFLDLACHCDIYDLFDDALFDTIALDPR